MTKDTLGFCVIIAVFAIFALFGHMSVQQKHISAEQAKNAELSLTVKRLQWEAHAARLLHDRTLSIEDKKSLIATMNAVQEEMADLIRCLGWETEIVTIESREELAASLARNHAEN